MINEDGEIAYNATQNILHAWGPSNSIVRAIILAFLTTLLSYQATATLVDLAFGTKKHGFARVRDIQLLLLVRRESPYAVARSLFKRLPFSRLPHADSRDVPGKLHASVVIKLLLLLCVAPIVNIGAIFLTLEFETDFTFRQIEFGGLAMGIDMNATRRGYVPVSQACVRAPVAVGRQEVALAEFAICDSLGQSLSVNAIEARVDIKASARNVIQVFISMPFAVESFFSAAHIVNNDPQVEFRDRYNFRVAHAATNETVEALANFAMDRVREFCGGGEVEIEPPANTEEKVDATTKLKVACSIEDSDEAREWFRNLVEDMRRKIVFVDSDKLEVVRNEDVEGTTVVPLFFSPDNEKILRRRNTYADIFIMFMLAIAMVLVRMFVRALTRNDLPRGIGLIVRDELGIPCCDSMLPSKDVVARYSGLAHIGIKHGEDDY